MENSKQTLDASPIEPKKKHVFNCHQTSYLSKYFNEHATAFYNLIVSMKGSFRSDAFDLQLTSVERAYAVAYAIDQVKSLDLESAKNYYSMGLSELFTTFIDDQITGMKKEEENTCILEIIGLSCCLFEMASCQCCHDLSNALQLECQQKLGDSWSIFFNELTQRVKQFEEQSSKKQSKQQLEGQSTDQPKGHSKEQTKDQSKEQHEQQSTDQPEGQLKEQTKDQSKQPIEQQSKDQPEGQSKEPVEQQSTNQSKGQSKEPAEQQSKQQETLKDWVETHVGREKAAILLPGVEAELNSLRTPTGMPSIQNNDSTVTIYNGPVTQHFGSVHEATAAEKNSAKGHPVCSSDSRATASKAAPFHSRNTASRTAPFHSRNTVSRTTLSTSRTTASRTAPFPSRTTASRTAPSTWKQSPESQPKCATLNLCSKENKEMIILMLYHYFTVTKPQIDKAYPLKKFELFFSGEEQEHLGILWYGIKRSDFVTQFKRLKEEDIIQYENGTLFKILRAHVDGTDIKGVDITFDLNKYSLSQKKSPALDYLIRSIKFVESGSCERINGLSPKEYYKEFVNSTQTWDEMVKEWNSKETSSGR